MEKEIKKRGIKKGAKLSKEHKEAISRGHKGLQAGTLNNNYKADRSKIKVGVSSFSVTADVKDWLMSQPNKTEYILRLIREDMKKNNI